MKLSISLFAFLNLIYIVSASGDLERCNAQCSVIRECNVLYSENTKNPMEKMPIWPPSLSKKPKVSQCYCNKMNEYETCLKCYYQPTPNKIPPKTEFEIECKALNAKLGSDPNANNPATSTTLNPSGVQTLPPSSSPTTGANPIPNTTTQNNGSKISNTSKLEDIKEDKESKNSKNNSSKYVLFGVIGCVALGGIIGFVVYNNKKKSRPESMPFYGNTVSSPNQYTTLDVPKSNTLNYNTNRTTNDNYYQQNTYNNYNYSNDNQFPAYQTMDYQYDNNTNPAVSSPNYQNYENVNTTINTMPTYDVVSNNNINTMQNENSVNYDNRRESMNQSMSMDQSMSQNNMAPISNSNNLTYTCSYPYEPKLDDELELRVNDKVKILEEFEDGWMKAMNITTGKEGMAPIVCVKETH